MDGVSIWFWVILIALALVPVPLVIAWISAILNTGNGTLGRQGFILRIVGLIVVYVAAQFAMAAMSVTVLLQVLSNFAPTAVISYWAVDRLRDRGTTSRAMAVLTGLPLIGMFIVIYLMTAPGRSQSVYAEAGARS